MVMRKTLTVVDAAVHVVNIFSLIFPKNDAMNIAIKIYTTHLYHLIFLRFQPSNYV